MCLLNLVEGARRLVYYGNECHHGDHEDCRARKRPAELVGPDWVNVVVVSQRLGEDDSKHDDRLRKNITPRIYNIISSSCQPLYEQVNEYGYRFVSTCERLTRMKMGLNIFQHILQNRFGLKRSMSLISRLNLSRPDRGKRVRIRTKFV